MEVALPYLEVALPNMEINQILPYMWQILVDKDFSRKKGCRNVYLARVEPLFLEVSRKSLRRTKRAISPKFPKKATQSKKGKRP
jgi:hypothetical protein